MSLIPNKRQWNSWSLPSKLTTIGTLIGIIMFTSYIVEKAFYLFDSKTELIVSKSEYEEKEKIKIDLFVQTKSIFAQLQDEYKEFINGKIELAFLGVMMSNSRTRITYSYYDKYSQGFLLRAQAEAEEISRRHSDFRKITDEGSIRIDNLRKTLSQKLDMINFYFDVNEELKKVILHLNVSSFNDRLAFQRANNSEILNHDMLKKWKEVAEKRGEDF